MNDTELPTRTSTSIRAVAEKADALIQWLEKSLNIRAGNSRLRIYAKQVRKLANLLEDNRHDEANSDVVMYHRALLELHEFFLPFDTFKSTGQITGLKELLKISIGGPEDRYSPNDIKSSSRNHFFEVQVGARLYGIGLPVEFPEANAVNGDVETCVEQRRVIIQCKRISSKKRIEQRFREAMDQLGSHWDVHPQSFGMVAIDISKILNENYQLLMVRDQSHAHSAMYSEMKSFSDEYIKPLVEIQGLIEKKCIGAIIYSGQMYMDAKEDARAHFPAYTLCYFWPDCEVGKVVLDQIDPRGV